METEKNIDKYGRRHTYLRISLTNKCNLACSYCVPKQGFRFSRFSEPLSDNEIVQFIQIAVGFGIQKIRFTGGEPLLRVGVETLIERVKAINGIREVCLTTNGTLLADKTKALKKAGLDSINISLDSLHSDRFLAITGRNAFASVVDGINSAIADGLTPKINVVALESLSFSEVDEFVAFAMRFGITVRFIEQMPLCGDSSNKIRFISLDQIEHYVTEKYDVSDPKIEGVARVYALNNGAIGFISPISHPFCSSCNRLRLSSNGTLYGCLFDSRGISISTLLRSKVPESQFYEVLKAILVSKKQSHGLSKWNFKKRSSEIKNLIRVIGG
jgi:cyclic pyranopterin phosphate synthase